MPESHSVDEHLLEQQLKFCLTILNKLKRNSNAGPFLKPVDHVALGIPDYPEKIKHPMDISTVRRNLETGVYKTPDEMHRDMTLMFDNCFLYNAEGTVVYEMGRDLQKVFEAYYRDLPMESVKKVKTAGSPRVGEKLRRTGKEPMSAEDAAVCLDILAELARPRHKKYTWPFMHPVSEKEAPGYFDVVKNPVDLSTMRKKVDARAYLSVDEFKADLGLIVENCFKFNAPGSEVYVCGEEFELAVGELMNAQKDPEQRMEELRRKISALKGELRRLEKAKAARNGTAFSLEDRERIGQAIIRMSRAQAEHVAEIVQRSNAYEYVDNDEIEVNMGTLPDEVVNEINEYVLQIGRSTEAGEGLVKE